MAAIPPHAHDTHATGRFFDTLYYDVDWARRSDFIWVRISNDHNDVID